MVKSRQGDRLIPRGDLVIAIRQSESRSEWISAHLQIRFDNVEYELPVTSAQLLHDWREVKE